MEATEKELADQLKRIARFERIYAISCTPSFVEMTGSVGGDAVTFRISKLTGEVTER